MAWPFKSSADSSVTSTIAARWDDDGIMFEPKPPRAEWLSHPMDFGARSELALTLRQLGEEGFAECGSDNACLTWDQFYRLSKSEDHASSFATLGMPPIERWTPALSSREGLSDEGFSVTIASWCDPEGRKVIGDPTLHGGVISLSGRESTLPEDTWRASRAVGDFWARPKSARDANSNRRAWADIRIHAANAQADMTDFLRKTVVLTPQRLRIELRKGEVDAVEVMPTFDGAPARWLEMFDRTGEVPERYDIPDGEGLIQVLLSPEVRTVLREIRRMPGRRVAGARAEAFVRNPFAALGPDASAVIDPEEFEKARDAAGIGFATFTARIERDGSGFPYECALMIEESVRGEVTADEYRFDGPRDLADFVDRLESKTTAGAQCCHWRGYELEILGDTPFHARVLREALEDIKNPGAVKASQIFDLSRYSERVEGFGAEKPYYSPFIARKSDDAGWFPENVDVGVCYTPEEGGDTVAISLAGKNLDKFKEAAALAKNEGNATFTFPGCPKPVPVDWAIDAIRSFDVAKGETSEKTSPTGKPPSKSVERKGLVVKPNVDILDYEERRGALDVKGTAAILPRSLRDGIELKEHQLVGVAWLQHLWKMSPEACRGALLADDMGLGKTIQLLTFIAGALEEKPGMDPFLIVAPVSLLENWKEEIGKFFVDGTMKPLTLYGPALTEKRVSKSALAKELIAAGATRLLKPGWLGSAKVVLTTYETLRDLEFSLAAQRWSAMICDEAQKIKNPNALVSRAAKKQNARLKIACTGTPVENTLTDIWCLFDFIQPGLLGALKDFGERFRRPIETDADEDGKSLALLRELIEPQKLRRMKAEVAKDLPNKIEVASCRRLPMSTRQRQLYSEAVALFRKREGGQGTGLQSPLGLLQHLRKLCTDPRPFGQLSSASESVADIEARSPKMAWLNATLSSIKRDGEKAIVFCEFKDLQRTLQRVIQERHGYLPDVINGDTSADAVNLNNRQARIRKFQDKPGFGVIILSPVAVGFGVNIQAANHVIHFSRTWNPAKEDQATDRAYRIGQTKDVHVYYPTVVADDFQTFDEKLDLLLSRKRALSSDMLRPAGDLAASEFGNLEAPGGGNAFGEELIEAGQVGSMTPHAFEALCAMLWSKQGFGKTATTKGSGDGGVDVVAIRGLEGALIQCKSSTTPGKLLGWEAIKDIAAGSAAYSAKYPGVKFALIAATNQGFNAAAKEQAKHLNVRLVEGHHFIKLLATHPTKVGELAQFLMMKT